MPRTLALITGASSGFGAEYARQLAASKCNLILTARREDKLAEVAREVTGAHGVSVDIVVADLATSEGIGRVAERIVAEPTLDLLINNAGYGFVETIRRSELSRHLDMNSVHITATLTLTHAALPGMAAAGGGEIINVSSMAAWGATPGSVSYSATKAYVNVFSEGVQAEVKNKNIHLQALCPGFTHTGFHASDEWGAIDMSWLPKEAWMDAGEVIRQSLAHLGSDSGVILIPGDQNRAVIAQSVKDPYWA